MDGEHNILIGGCHAPLTTAAGPAEVKAAARARRLPMKVVCHRAGVSPSTFTRWQNGTSEISLRKLRALVSVINRPEVQP